MEGPTWSRQVGITNNKQGKYKKILLYYWTMLEIKGSTIINQLLWLMPNNISTSEKGKHYISWQMSETVASETCTTIRAFYKVLQCWYLGWLYNISNVADLRLNNTWKNWLLSEQPPGLVCTVPGSDSSFCFCLLSYNVMILLISIYTVLQKFWPFSQVKSNLHGTRKRERKGMLNLHPISRSCQPLV